MTVLCTGVSIPSTRRCATRAPLSFPPEHFFPMRGVLSAQAGIHRRGTNWMPACAGKTNRETSACAELRQGAYAYIASRPIRIWQIGHALIGRQYEKSTGAGLTLSVSYTHLTLPTIYSV